MKKLLHKISHLLKRNKGKIYSEIKNGKVFIGFKCETCGRIEGFHNVENVIERELLKNDTLQIPYN